VPRRFTVKEVIAIPRFFLDPELTNRGNWLASVNSPITLRRRTTAIVLAASLLSPSMAVAQPGPGGGAPAVPGPAVAPPLPSAPPSLPADSLLLRVGGPRPDACSGISFGLGVGRVALPQDYRLGPGDQVDVQVTNRLEVTKQQVIVDPEGVVTLPPAGRVEVDGLTLLEAQQRINEQLRQVFRYTEVGLSLQLPRCLNVVVTGEVERPGATQASAIRRVHEVVLLSGGVTPRGSVRFVELFPRTGEPRTVDLLRFELNGDLAQNPLVEEGLRIHVPPRAGYVTLSGAVRRPGTYELARAGGLRDVLDLMGGLSQGAAASKARLTHVGVDGRHVSADLDLAAVLRGEGDVPLTAGDVLYVPPGLVLQDVVEVRGALLGTADSAKTTTTGKPTVMQRFELARGDRVRDLLVKAGGPSPLADLRLALVERTGAAGPRRQIPVDLQRLLVDKEEYQNILLENGDVLVVPLVEDKVYVLGEVKQPGPLDYRSGATLREYLAMAGGPTVRARFQHATVTFRDGRSFGVAEAPPIEPGATVSIPEVSVRWYQDYLSIFTAIAGLVTSYTGLYLLFGGGIKTSN
jgi:polysaccharide biosynthesis/export protein